MRKKRLTIGIIALMLGSIALVAFHYRIAVPFYYNALANQTYGELFGPVSFFLWPIYSCCALMIILGFFLVVLSASGRDNSP